MRSNQAQHRPLRGLHDVRDHKGRQHQCAVPEVSRNQGSEKASDDVGGADQAHRIEPVGDPPPPLVSGKTLNNDDIEELKQFDRGHLVALEIDGADSYRCIVPMNRQFNQSGKWRTMERTIGKLIDGVDQKDVDGGTVKGEPVPMPP